MLFYTALFIACLIIAVIVPVLYHLFTDAGSAFCESINPDSHKWSNSFRKKEPKDTGKNEMPVPAGLVNNEVRGILAFSGIDQLKVSHQFGGDNSYSGPGRVYAAPPQLITQTQSPRIIRKDRITDYGSSYKVTRKVTVVQNGR